jgi:hypothetical protein
VKAYPGIHTACGLSNIYLKAAVFKSVKANTDTPNSGDLRFDMFQGENIERQFEVYDALYAWCQLASARNG